MNDAFYDIIAAQEADPEFSQLAGLSAGTLVCRRTDDSNGVEKVGSSMDDGSDIDDEMVFQATLMSDGRLTIKRSMEVPKEAVINLLEHLKQTIEDDESLG